MADSFGAEEITRCIGEASGPAVCAYVTAGYPTLEAFPSVLESVARSADVVEVGVPFTDPMADGLTIQQASQVALANGVNLEWIFELLSASDLAAPHVLMGYYNPFLAFGLGRLGDAMTGSRTSGLIIPDLPLEESAPIREVLEPKGLALVQLVTPSTSSERLRRITSDGAGFIYAVTTTGVTGGKADLPAEALQYLDRVSSASALPVLAGFGVRNRAQVTALALHVDGVVIGSALIEAIDRGEDPGAFLDELRAFEITA
ncbi:MAG: tryptophan synthase subunit alpha [Acidimicrobiia bacterium]